MTRAAASAFAGGRYAVERELGRGGMATVLLARDRELDRPVAVKVLDDRVAGDEELLRRFRREALTAAQLAHPNVVQVFDAGEEAGRLYIVMECVEGEGLDAVLRREGRLPPERALDLVAQACAGLGYAHGRGIVHRDVKPANLLLRRDGVLKVADFGIAYAADATRVTEVGTLMGTAAYVAPEQARGGPVGPAADVFSLGVVAYQLLTGRVPWPVESLAELASVGETPATPVRELVPEVPAAVEAVVMRCLARNPDYRPASAAEVAGELRGEEPATVRPGAARRRPPAALVTAAAAVALAAVAAGLLAAVSGGDEPAPVEPVPASSDPAGQARNLEEWLREHTRGAAG